MIISKKRFDESISNAKEMTRYEERERWEFDNRFKYLHERIDQLEKKVFELQYSNKPEENELKCCSPVIG